MKKFWIVGRFDPPGKGAMATNPHKHTSQYAAQVEAERLAKIMPGSQFVVFEAKVASFTAPRPVTTYALHEHGGDYGRF